MIKEKQLSDELLKMPTMVVETAYLYAMNITSYGVDVTEKWLTATQNASAMERAYRKGYYDALQRQAEVRNKDEQNLILKQEPILDKIRAEIESYKLSEDELSDMDEDSVKWGMKIACDIVDKYKAGSEG